ncbi:MAG TPA: ankyrin repeat domain-containing protein [Kiloniellales bacterium]
MTGEGEVTASDVLAAVTAGGSKALAKALEAGGDANARDRWGAPVLAIAAGRDDLESVRLLLEHGADPNLASAVGNSPLMIAAARGRPEVARVLLAAGAKPTATNNWGLSAADWAQWAKDPAEIRALFVGDKSRT